jgi:carboxymethylenebutenolidase
MSSTIRARAIALYDAFTHEHHDRRAFMAQMVALAGSAAAADALILGIAPAEAAAQQVDPLDPRLKTARTSGTEAGQPIAAYFAALKDDQDSRGYVLIIHENRGLNAHIEDVARRIALAGFRAIAPDFLTPQGGTPADPDKARALIGTLDYDLALAQAVAMAERLRAGPQARKVGAVGFCWGGAFVNRFAVAAGARLTAGVSYYGPAPAPTEASKVSARMLVHLAGNDARVNATGVPWGDALKAGGKGEAFVYPGVEHAFNNDTSTERYNAAAATLAWDRTIGLFKARLT